MPVIINGSTGISGTDGSAATPAVQGTDANTGMFFPAADTIAFAEGGTEAMRLDASGNVGIGTTTPGARLDVSGASNTAVARIISTDSTRCDLRFQTSGSNSGLYFGNSTTFDLGRLFYDNAGNNMVFVTNSAERARITSGGTLCLNAANPTINSKTPLLLAYQTPSQPPISCYVNTTSAANQITFHNPNGEVGQINSGGTGVSYNTGSDYRLKHDVSPLIGGLATIAALKPSTYKWNADDSHGEGFIAHELAEHIPLAVTGEKDAVNADGSIKPQGVDYSKIVVHLVAAVQELTTKLEAAEARIATLEAR
jgi:hypothetical protein